MESSSQPAFNFDAANSRPSEHRLEQVLRATDLLLESGGFGLIVLDLSDLPLKTARRIPLTTWFRFRRAVENKPTILLAIEQQPIAGSCSSLLLQLGASDLRVDESAAKQSNNATQRLSHAHLFTGLNINAELTHSRLERKPARSIAFATKTAWAG
jgi:recombination protein RecA